jgi:hypothetical protein
MPRATVATVNTHLEKITSTSLATTTTAGGGTSLSLFSVLCAARFGADFPTCYYLSSSEIGVGQRFLAHAPTTETVYLTLRALVSGIFVVFSFFSIITSFALIWCVAPPNSNPESVWLRSCGFHSYGTIQAVQDSAFVQVVEQLLPPHSLALHS